MRYVEWRQLNPIREESEWKMDRTGIAARLVQLRGEKTKEEVSGALNISVRALESYESANRSPRDSVKMLIADYYGVSVESLFFTR